MLVLALHRLKSSVNKASVTPCLIWVGQRLHCVATNT